MYWLADQINRGVNVASMDSERSSEIQASKCHPESLVLLKDVDLIPRHRYIAILTCTRLLVNSIKILQRLTVLLFGVNVRSCVALVFNYDELFQFFAIGLAYFSDRKDFSLESKSQNQDCDTIFSAKELFKFIDSFFAFFFFLVIDLLLGIENTAVRLDDTKRSVLAK